MFEFCNKRTGRSWWVLVEIMGLLVLGVVALMVMPCLDLSLDVSRSFGAAYFIGSSLEPDNPPRVVIYGRWVIADADSHWVYFSALCGLTFGSRIGLLLMLLGDKYAQGMVCKTIRPHWLLPMRVWVKPPDQEG